MKILDLMTLAQSSGFICPAVAQQSSLELVEFDANTPSIPVDRIVEIAQSENADLTLCEIRADGGTMDSINGHAIGIFQGDKEDPMIDGFVEIVGANDAIYYSEDNHSFDPRLPFRFVG